MKSMESNFSRRDFLQALAAIGFVSGTGLLPLRAAFAANQAVGSAPASSNVVPLGKPQPFDFAWLKGHARALAAAPYKPPAEHHYDALRKLTYDDYQAIHFRPDHALWAQDDARFRLQFFHLGLFYQWPVRLHELRDGQAQALASHARQQRAVAHADEAAHRVGTRQERPGFGQPRQLQHVARVGIAEFRHALGPGRVAQRARRHHLHHSRPAGNYGFALPFMDQIMGTKVKTAYTRAPAAE